MDIYIGHSHRVREIFIQGEFQSKEDICHFYDSVKNCKTEIKITFLTANTLPCDVIEKLLYLNSLGNCCIEVFARNLYFYLYRLGINCTYLHYRNRQEKIRIESSNKKRYSLNEEEIKVLLQAIYHKYGYDYTQYNMQSIKRRIHNIMTRLNLQTIEELEADVLNNKNTFKEVFLEFSINITDFFRDPEVFAFIRQSLLPALSEHKHIKVWCVGCSNGKEPYSLAILLEELGMLHKTQIYATDINPYIIEEAKNGFYSSETIERDKKNYEMAMGSNAFVDSFHLEEKYMKIRKKYKKNILFFQNNVVNSRLSHEFQMIICRNLLMYFDVNLQRKVLEKFYSGMDREGYLVLGRSEEVTKEQKDKLFDVIHHTHKIYRKK
ncbi:chemotaxis protein methyltransferase CheR [Natronincola peptidivorans]|uniref:Chemotaxis protein methyltransferase CheR n=1 Tax=Natronincola peptidivorans TaxID=426128 RepID=A0A1I0DWA3_9FIRM|nr:protein-glutamate O-methyltransferase CheR [Natronincola peptidivorans]SET36775.1 chemotaxis protein methyltransferase CheR [Natronincola peptidivorans]